MLQLVASLKPVRHSQLTYAPTIFHEFTARGLIEKREYPRFVLESVLQPSTSTARASLKAR